MQELTYVWHVALAVALGGIVGFQRERWGKSAGPRTYALVSGGAALFTLLSVYGFGGADPSRVASQIVIGIGFLGAGIIWHKEGHTEGLTSAAGLWMIAALGMTVGLSMYVLAAGVTALMLLVLVFDDRKWRVSRNKE